jgi:lipid-A-disaccharide synthase-like uncharacterized protein
MSKFWLYLGFTGQFLFGARFLIQWVATERLKKSVIPVSFWYLSIFGSIILLIYAIERKDPVFIMGQSLGLIVYFRNLQIIFNKENKKVEST